MLVSMDTCPLTGQLVALCNNPDCEQPLPLEMLPRMIRLGETGPGWIEGAIYCSRCADRARDERDATDPFSLFEQVRELSL